MNPNLKWLRPVLVILIPLFLLIVINPVSVVESGKRGTRLRLGKIQGPILEPGVHYKLPLIDRIILTDVQTQVVQAEAESYSKDLQNVKATIALNFHTDPTQVDKLWQEIGGEYRKRIIEPVVQESVKAATAQFTAAELIAKRPEVKEAIKKTLVERLSKRFLIVDEFSIINFEFADSYEAAIEKKQVAEQEALRAENELRKVKIEAEQRITQAKAEAEAIKIQTEALQQNQNLIRLEAVKRWNGQLPHYMMGNSVPFVQIPTENADTQTNSPD